jgi:hypothetical protein
VVCVCVCGMCVWCVVCVCTADPWDPQANYPEEKAVEEKSCVLRISRAQCFRCLTHFPHNSTQLHLKPCCLLQTSHFPFITSIKHIYFYLDLGAPFAFWVPNFHTVQGRESLSTTHNDLSTTENNTGLTESSSVPTEWRNASAVIQNLYF